MSLVVGTSRAPRYVPTMRRVTRDDPAPVDDQRRFERLSPGDLASSLRRKGTILHVRPAADFAADHVPATLNAPFARSVLNRAGLAEAPAWPSLQIPQRVFRLSSGLHQARMSSLPWPTMKATIDGGNDART